MRSGAFVLYSGAKEVRRPPAFHLDNAHFQLGEDASRSLHAFINNANGYIHIKHMSTNAPGVIYTDDDRDIDSLRAVVQLSLLKTLM